MPAIISERVPLPAAHLAKRRYNWHQLGLADSIAFPIEAYSRAIQAAYRYKVTTPSWDYAARIVTENGQRKVRIWRIA